MLRSGTVLAMRDRGAELGFAFDVALVRVLGADGLGVHHLVKRFVSINGAVRQMGMDGATRSVYLRLYAATDYNHIA